MVQGLRIHLAVQGMQVRSLVRGSHAKEKLSPHCTTEPLDHNKRVYELQGKILHDAVMILCEATETHCSQKKTHKNQQQKSILSPFWRLLLLSCFSHV